MKVMHPSQPEEFNHRNLLLTQSLRPETLEFPVASEYPIVLSQSHAEFSFIAVDGTSLLTHANWWPRHLIAADGRTMDKIALIGNVATDPSKRGQGHMRHLFADLEQHSRNMGCSALVLWSDLDRFYQKLGFTSLGREFRFLFQQHNLPTMRLKSGQILPISAKSLTDEDLCHLLALRPKVPYTLERSIHEYRTLLAIPHMQIWLRRDQGRITAFALMGKGYDMQGVIHEWGGEKPELILEMIGEIVRHNEMKEIMILAPAFCEGTWLRQLGEAANLSEEHPMALVKILNENAECSRRLTQSFIWGLDSI